MYYVYFLRSKKFPDKTYVGFTNDLKARLKKHNEGGSIYTSEFKPWQVVTFIGFDSEEKALNFEKYIKSGSGYSFAKKRFW